MVSLQSLRVYPNGMPLVLSYSCVIVGERALKKKKDSYCLAYNVRRYQQGKKKPRTWRGFLSVRQPADHINRHVAVCFQMVCKIHSFFAGCEHLGSLAVFVGDEVARHFVLSFALR